MALAALIGIAWRVYFVQFKLVGLLPQPVAAAVYPGGVRPPTATLYVDIAPAGMDVIELDTQSADPLTTALASGRPVVKVSVTLSMRVDRAWLTTRIEREASISCEALTTPPPTASQILQAAVAVGEYVGRSSARGYTLPRGTGTQVAREWVVSPLEAGVGVCCVIGALWVSAVSVRDFVRGAAEWRRRWRIESGRCPCCGFDLRGVEGKTCPECGVAAVDDELVSATAGSTGQSHA